MNAQQEVELFTTSLAVKGFLQKPDGRVLLLVAEGLNGEIFWDLPGGGARKGVDVARSIAEKIKGEIPNLDLDIKDFKPSLFICPNDGLERLTLGRRINNHDILFVGTVIPVDQDFEPKLSEHIEYRWIREEEFNALPEGNGTRDNPTLNPWLKNLAQAHFEGIGVRFNY